MRSDLLFQIEKKKMAPEGNSSTVAKPMEFIARKMVQ